MNTFEEWVRRIVDADELCASYYKKVSKAMSNKQLIDISMDSNGMSYLCEMEQKGLDLPYQIIMNRFRPFINGQYVSEHKTKGGDTYTSAIYCCYNDDIVANTTLLTVLGVEANICVSKNNCCTIYVDKHSKVTITCPVGSCADVYYWCDEEPDYSGNVKLIRMK